MNELKMSQIQDSPNLTDLSHELLCQILKYLPLKEVLALSTLCKKLLFAVDMHLRLCKSIDFCQDKIYGYMPSSITDDHMHSLLKKCPHLETVYGLHPLKVERRRLRKRSALTVPGIIEALCLCYNLKAIETCDLKLLEAVMQVLPQLEIIGNFRNRDGVFPPHASQRLKLQPYPRISSLHLIGVEVPELTAMPHLQHLHLQCVRFTKLQPFRAFLAQNLKTFVMKHCMGPSVSLRYLSLIIALSSSPSLSRLELVRVPLPGGLFQRAVEDSYRHNGFVSLKTLVIAGCKGVLESDLGHLMIVASKNLESLFIQPSLTKDSLFVSLSFAQCEFPKLKNLHLGYVDKLNSSGEWSNDVLLTLGLAEVPDTPSSLTDSGMRVVSELFPRIRTMSVSNCPHLMAMDQWSPVEGVQAWKELTDLTLQKCHCLQLPSFALFLALLPKVEVVILNDMFREPPKGCSHVGLSAGTGLGMSSAVVSNQDEHIAVQGHQQDFEPQGDEQLLENDEIDRDYVEGDNEIRPEPHLMVLQQDFFDEQNNVVHVPVEIRENINDGIIVADDDEDNLNPVQIPAGSINYNDHQVQEETSDEDTETDDDDGAVASPSITPNEASRPFIKQEIEDDNDYVPSAMEIMQTVKRIKREIPDYDYLQPSTSSQNPCCVKIEKTDECKERYEVPDTNLNNVKQSKCGEELNDLSEGTAISHCPSSAALDPDSVDSDNQNAPSSSKTSKSFRVHINGTCVNQCVCLKVKHDITDSERYAYFDSEQPSKGTARSHCPSSAALNVDSADSGNQNTPSSSKTSKKTFRVHNMDSKSDIGGTCVNDCACLKAIHSLSDSEKNTNFDPQQPSTSKIVDCPEYSNADLTLASRKSVATQSDLGDASVIDCSEVSNADLMLDGKKSVATQSDFSIMSVTRKRKMHDEKVKNSKEMRKCNKEEFNANSQMSSNTICKRKNQKLTSSNNPEDFLHFEGPLTRQRSKMLTAHLKEESVTCAIENQKRMGVSHVQANSGQCRICLHGDCCRKINVVSSGTDRPNGLTETGCTCKHPFQNKQARNRRSSSKHSSSCALKMPSKSMTSSNRSCLSKQNKSSHTNSCDRGILLQSSERHNSLTIKKTNFEANKTDENIAIKKCRISHGSELSHHIPCVQKKKGKVVCSHTQEHVTSQGTQATSADIRRTLRRFRTSKVRIVKLTSKAPGCLETFSVSATKQYKRCKLPKSLKDLQNKATSTSDPLMEDDAVQTLRLVSETLISLTIVSCGISHIIIDHCQRMTHIEVQACRILKKFQLNYCPRVKRVNVSQCPKLAAETFFPEIISVSTINSLLVSFEPCMQSYQPIDGERIIFSKATPDQSIIVFHDFTDNSHEIVQAVFKESLLGWMEFVQRVYSSLNLLRAKKIHSKSVVETSRKARYPWGHDLRRIHGFYLLPPTPNPCATEWKYEMLTNNYVFARAFEFLPWDKGVPRAEFCGDYHKLPIYPFILYEIAERTVQMPKTLTTFYIPITESN